MCLVLPLYVSLTYKVLIVIDLHFMNHQNHIYIYKSLNVLPENVTCILDTLRESTLTVFILAWTMPLIYSYI